MVYEDEHLNFMNEFPIYLANSQAVEKRLKGWVKNIITLSLTRFSLFVFFFSKFFFSHLHFTIEQVPRITSELILKIVLVQLHVTKDRN